MNLPQTKPPASDITASFHWGFNHRLRPVSCWSYRIWPQSRTPPISPANVYANADPLAVSSQCSCGNWGLTVIQIVLGFTSRYVTGSSWSLRQVCHLLILYMPLRFCGALCPNINIQVWHSTPKCVCVCPILYLGLFPICCTYKPHQATGASNVLPSYLTQSSQIHPVSMTAVLWLLHPLHPHDSPYAVTARAEEHLCQDPLYRLQLSI